MKDERLRKFQGWLEAKGDDPHAVLALRRITDFEEYTEEDEGMLREFKDWLKSQDEERLKQFQGSHLRKGCVRSG
jgi:hypothetical protein